MFLYFVLLVACATVNADTSMYIFNQGNCPGGDCCAGLTCSCNTTQIEEAVKEYAVTVETPLVPLEADGSQYMLGPQFIGMQDIDLNTGSAIRCDHRPQVTVVFKKPMLYNGDIKYVEWLMSGDCKDSNAQGKKNKAISFGFFKGNPTTCGFELVASKTYQRSILYDTFLSGNGGTKKVKIIFTSQDRLDLKVLDQSLQGLYFGFTMDVGGCVGYPKWADKYIGTAGSELNCLYDYPHEFEPWEEYDFSNTTARMPDAQFDSHAWRNYFLHLEYQPL